MNATIITDCKDENARGRLETRCVSLFRCPTSFIGVDSEVEASGNLIDTLDAFENRKGIILVNVAPRNGKGKKFKNGTPFGYFRYKNVLIVSTIDGITLSLAKKLKLVDKIHIIDLKKSLANLIKADLYKNTDRKRIEDTQFRSYEFQPKAAKYLLENRNLPGKKISIEKLPDPPETIWWFDNFGNGKTTLLSSDLPLKDKVVFDKFSFYKNLKDVPSGKKAIVEGSSGIGNKRFLEIVVQGGSAKKFFNLKIGDKLNIVEY